METSSKLSTEKRSKTQSDSSNNLQDGENTNSSKMEDLKLRTHSPNMNTMEEPKEDTVEGLRSQLETLMNSLATLSSEKSKMEATFQTEKKQLRNEREEYEKILKNLKEKLKRIQGHAMSEVEHVKYKLIMERHEREKEQAEHSTTTKELQKMVNNELKAREQLELQLKELKNSVPSKSQSRLLEAELDALKKKLKQAEASASETPAMLMNLQSEMSMMRKKYRNAILEEQKRAAAAEHEARALAASHESRVAGLEARLAELSDIVGGYDRFRQQDQKAIQKLKEQLITLQSYKPINNHESPHDLIEKIKNLYFQLVEVDNDSSCANVKDLLNSLKLSDESQGSIYKEKYEAALQELKELKKHPSKNESCSQNNENIFSNDETLLHRAKSHNRNLEEKVRMLVTEMAEKENIFKEKLEKQQQILQEQYLKTDQLLAQKDSEYLNKIGALEQQLLRQRERSLSVIQEKDKEIQMLKSSFDALLPKKSIMLESGQKLNVKMNNLKTEASDLVSGLLTVDNNPPMLHYTQELARKEVQISGLRKQNVQLEAALRELERNSFRAEENHEEELKKMESQIKRLEASKSRENANLEYLKNVFINYLTSNDTARKRHMLNAISTVLQFTSEETEKISKHK